MNLCEYFPTTRIVNLSERRDRRREITRELANFGIRPGSDGVEFFDAVRPEDAGEFPSVGVRGCFLSHLDILREAMSSKLESVLIMEDDLSISPLLPQVQDELIRTLESEEWDIAYFGYTDSDKIYIDTDRKLVRYTEVIGCTHFYAVHRRVMPNLIEFLEMMILTRPLGHPEAGPMHYDGALATFRARNPEVLTLLAYPCLGFQRSSRSDIYTHWFERIPILRQASDLARVSRTWIRMKAKVNA